MDLFKSHFDDGLHALTLRALTPDEWNESKEQSFASPACAHRK
jgi:BolA protein